MTKDVLNKIFELFKNYLTNRENKIKFFRSTDVKIGENCQL